MKLIYELRNNDHDIDHLKNGMGWSAEFLPIFEATNGIVGSEEWWSSIASGNVKKCTISGLVRGLWLGQWECGPAHFLIELESGETFSSDCQVSVEEAVKEYKLGRICQIEYVVANYRDPIRHLAKNRDIILKITLGEMSNEPVLPYGLCHFSKSF